MLTSYVPLAKLGSIVIDVQHCDLKLEIIGEDLVLSRKQRQIYNIVERRHEHTHMYRPALYQWFTHVLSNIHVNLLVCCTHTIFVIQL